MITGGLIEIAWGVKTERRGLESIAIHEVIAAERREDLFREPERRINRPDRAAPRAGWRERLRSALSDEPRAR